MAHQRRPGEGMQCSAFCKKLKKKTPNWGKLRRLPDDGKNGKSQAAKISSKRAAFTGIIVMMLCGYFPVRLEFLINVKVYNILRSA